MKKTLKKLELHVQCPCLECSDDEEKKEKSSKKEPEDWIDFVDDD